MSGTTAFLYNDDFMLYQFGPGHPFQPIREKLALDTLSSLGVFECGPRVVVPGPVDLEHLHRVHPPEFVSFVERTCQANGELDQGDTPANPGLFKGALAAVGATLRGAQGIMAGEFEHAFNPAGGLHHAHPTRASGFCVFNDVAVAVRALQMDFGLQRIAVVDIDGHHGDGTQDIFYEESGVLTVSLHRYGRGFFPGSGSTEERGEGEGRGYNMNIPLPPGTDDNLYLRAFRALVIPALRSYQPQFIIHQFGTDGHYKDPLVGLGLTTRGYEEIARMTHEAAHQLCDGRYLVVGGGGYDIDATRRTWSIMFAGLSGAYPHGSARITAMHDQEELFSDERNAVEVNRVIDKQEEASLPMLEKMIRYA